jgi:hypothetical protein
MPRASQDRNRPAAGVCGAPRTDGRPCGAVTDAGERCRRHGGQGRTPGPKRLAETCCAELATTWSSWRTHCASTAAVYGVDGQPYCIPHARSLERSLNAWADDVAAYERHMGIPDWLPGHLHLEWLQLRRAYWHGSAGDIDLGERIRAVTRMRELERAYDSDDLRL